MATGRGRPPGAAWSTQRAGADRRRSAVPRAGGGPLASGWAPNGVGTFTHRASVLVVVRDGIWLMRPHPGRTACSGPEPAGCLEHADNRGEATMTHERRTSPIRAEAVSAARCSPSLRREILGRSRYFNELAAGVLEKVNERFRELHYPTDTIICHEGATADRLFFVAHGKVKLLRHSPGGKDVVLDILAQAALFGGLAPLGTRRCPETAVAQTDCCVLAISGADFQQLLQQHPAVTLAVLHSVAHSLDEARETIRQLTTSDVRARIATVLLKLAERIGDVDGQGVLIRSPLSRLDLAAMVGATSETASRVMADFKRDRLVDSGRQWVRILDRSGLAAVSGC